MAMGEACGVHASWVRPARQSRSASGQGPIIGARIEYSLGTLLDVGPEGWVKPIGSQPKHARSGGFMGYSP